MNPLAPDPVDRLARALALGFAAAALLAAWRASTPRAVAPGPDAAELWERHCAGCHDRAELRATLGASGGRDIAALTEFLATHGRSDAAADRVLAVDLLQSAAR